MTTYYLIEIRNGIWGNIFFEGSYEDCNETLSIMIEDGDNNYFTISKQDYDEYFEGPEQEVYEKYCKTEDYV